MEEAKFIADFIATNLDKILKISKSAYDKANEDITISIKSAYKNYLKNCSNKYSKSKSFFIRDQPVDLYSYYVPSGLMNRTNNIKKPSIKNCLDISKRICISGTGGSGKSVLMKHLFLDCITSMTYVPILVELRDLNNEKKTLNQYIEEILDTYGFKTSGGYIEKSKLSGHFCFLLDGYDEVNHSKRNNLLKQALKLSRKYPECPLIISSRPDDALSSTEDFTTLKITPLTLDTAIELISKLPFDKEIKTKFIKNLKENLFKEHRSFLSNPLLLSIMLLTYGENAEIPNKLSIFYNQAYEALFQRHDANKGGYNRKRLTNLDIQDFSKIFSLFCLQTYEKRLFKMSRVDSLNFIKKSKEISNFDFNQEDYLADLLSAACLMIEDGLEISFSHRSFQEYFVALYISSAPPNQQDKLINRYYDNFSSDNVLYLLTELNQELMERVLFIPKLEKFFKEIGITKKVGVTHAAKYMKSFFKIIKLTRNETIATYEPKKANLDRIFALTTYLYQTYKIPTDSEYKKQRKELHSLYGDSKDISEFETKELSYKTPLLADLLKGHGKFSISYLQAVFDGLNKMKSKNINAESSIDKLLEN